MTVPVTRIIDGRSIVAQCAPGQERAAGDVLDSFARAAASHPLAAGYRLRFGWTMFTLEDQRDALVVCEPDFDRDPLQADRPRIDASLDVIARQLAALRAAGAQPADVRFDDLLVTVRGVLSEPEVHMVRDPPSRDGDSGWRIFSSRAAAPPRDGELVAIRVYELLSLRPAALAAMAFPEGSAVIIRGDTVVPVLP